jgi:hypothetical protein
MENHPTYTAQTQSGLHATQACSPHSATISNDSLNDLLQLIGLHKNPVLSDTHGFRAMTLPPPTLDSTVFQSAEQNPRI